MRGLFITSPDGTPVVSDTELIVNPVLLILRLFTSVYFCLPTVCHGFCSLQNVKKLFGLAMNLTVLHIILFLGLKVAAKP